MSKRDGKPDEYVHFLPGMEPETPEKVVEISVPKKADIKKKSASLEVELPADIYASFTEKGYDRLNNLLCEKVWVDTGFGNKRKLKSGEKNLILDAYNFARMYLETKTDIFLHALDNKVKESIESHKFVNEECKKIRERV